MDERLYNVGRLDADTSGLLVLTKTARLRTCSRIPRSGSRRSTSRRSRGAWTAQTIARLTRGVTLEDGEIAAPARRQGAAARRLSGESLVELTLHSGRNRIVRRMMAEVGHPVVELVRRQFGPLHMGTLPVGRARALTTVERGALLTLSRQSSPEETP